MEFTAKQVAQYLGGRVDGNEDVKLNTFSKIEEGKNGSLTFLANKKYTHYIYTTQASAILVEENFTPEKPVTGTLIRVKNPYECLASLLQLADSFKPKKSGIKSTAVISDSANIGENVFIGDYVVIGENVTVADNAVIYPHCFLDDNAVVGKGSKLYSGVKVYENSKIGCNCILHAGVVIGSDGFGFAPDAEGRFNKIPQIGNVIIEDDVEIGANSTIDCATMGSTIIHRGVKIDNLCQVAHNVVLGEHSAMAAQSGIAGSTKVGQHCIFAGQVGVVGHVEIADGSTFGAKTGVSGNIRTPGKTWAGCPELDIMNFRKSSVLVKRLPDLYDRISELEHKLNELTGNK